MAHGKGRVVGKVAVVTGGSLGFGRACALLLAEEGATVAVTDVLDQEGEALVGEIRASGGQAHFWHLDVRNECEVVRVLAEIKSEFGNVTVLVNNAGIAPRHLCDFGVVPGSDDSNPMHLHRLIHNGTYATIKALAAAVDAKDAYTHGHSDRVAQYATDLARYLGAGADEVDLIHRCATLHDVGKIGVPDAVLQKPGRLDPEEVRVMQTHAALGEYIVGKVPELSDLLPGVRHHHERYDGKGYPDGLKGEEIPRVARLLAVADTYDAMTSNRPYRLSLGPAKALKEIKAMAGTQFDPKLAQAFVQMMRAQRAAV